MNWFQKFGNNKNMRSKHNPKNQVERLCQEEKLTSKARNCNKCKYLYKSIKALQFSVLSSFIVQQKASITNKYHVLCYPRVKYVLTYGSNKTVVTWSEFVLFRVSTRKAYKRHSGDQLTYSYKRASKLDIHLNSIQNVHKMNIPKDL